MGDQGVKGRFGEADGINLIVFRSIAERQPRPPPRSFEPAIRYLASHTIMSPTTTPSGDTESLLKEDLEITRRLSGVGKILGNEIIDHVIVMAKDKFFESFKRKKFEFE